MLRNSITTIRFNFVLYLFLYTAFYKHVCIHVHTCTHMPCGICALHICIHVCSYTRQCMIIAVSNSTKFSKFYYHICACVYVCVCALLIICVLTWRMNKPQSFELYCKGISYRKMVNLFSCSYFADDCYVV